jgi:glycosyltransferase involved in cell wall biosynthesis
VRSAKSEHDAGGDLAYRPLSIFVPHGATKLTDHESHGDGLVQWAFVCELARRGHRLTVLTPAVAIRGPIPENVEIRQIAGGEGAGLIGYVLRARMTFARLRRERHFDLVHQMNPVVRGASLAWAFSGVPVILGTYVGDWPYEVPVHRMRTAGTREWLKMASKLALDAVQQIFARRLLLATAFARNRIAFPATVRGRIAEVRHGIDVDRYSPEPSPADPLKRANSVLFVGQILAHKGIAVLLDAFDIVHRAMPEARLVVVGCGDLESLVEARARRGGWSAELEMVGPVAHDRVPGWLRACTILCSSALGEPFGQTVVEALACGTPVIVNDSGGPAHVIAGTENPIVPMGDPGALARAILALLRDPERVRHLGEQNRRLAVAKYAWPRVVDELERIYREVLAERV